MRCARAGCSSVSGRRAPRRARAWALGARPERIVFEIDATLLTSHSDKERAAGNYKGGFGFHPLCCFIDESEEAPAALLRPGNAGANTAADHVEVFDRALEQLPREVAEQAQLVVRCDSAGATHELTDHLHAGNVRFSVGFDLTEDVRQAIAAIGHRDWVSAISQDGEKRNDAFVCELSLDLSAWPEGSRAICRRERAHPGAQLSLIDTGGWRHQVFITDLDGELAERDRSHRARAGCEDRVRCAKDIGMRNLPFRDFDANEVWLELSLIAQDLLAWARPLCVDRELASAEPKRLRYRLLHQAGRVERSGRRTKLRLARSWPWAEASPPPSRASGRCPLRRLRDRPPPALTTSDRRQPADQAGQRARRASGDESTAEPFQQSRSTPRGLTLTTNHLTQQQPRSRTHQRGG